MHNAIARIDALLAKLPWTDNCAATRRELLAKRIALVLSYC